MQIPIQAMSYQDSCYEQRILRSWQENAGPWSEAIEGSHIESRRLVTDDAIVAAVTALGGKAVLDIGCGEGWLCRALAARGCAVTGIDAIESLLESARRRGGGRFLRLDYSDLSPPNLALLCPDGRFDILVANFSLLGRESVEQVVAAAGALLNPGGYLVVQTLHPPSACGDQAYEDGWRESSWAGFSDAFRDPAPWYFRTIDSWLALLQSGGLEPVQQVVPCHPDDQRPLSIIFVARHCA